MKMLFIFCEADGERYLHAFVGVENPRLIALKETRRLFRKEHGRNPKMVKCRVLGEEEG